MAILKPLSGHGNLSTNQCRDYLLGIGKWEHKYSGQRCSMITYINIDKDSTSGLSWDEQMDHDREMSGTNQQLGKNPTRTYNHYIFSPSPNDNVSPEELDEAITEWAERVFQNKFSIVIGYHNDNTNNVQHAHMFINNINWNTSDKYKRIGSYVTPMCWEYASQLWQYICKERGWYSFIDKQKADIDTAEAANPEDLVKETDNFTRSTENLFKIDQEYFKNHRYFNHDINYKRPYNYSRYKISRPYTTKFKRNYTKAALKAKQAGKHLWTDDIRDLIEIAFFQSKNVNQFYDKLAKYGVNIELTSNKDFKYSHPADPQRRVTGAKLGKDYTRQQIYSKYAHINDWNNKYIHAPSSFNSFVSPIVEGIANSLTTASITVKNDNNFPGLTEVAKMIRVCSFYDAWTKIELENTYFEIQNTELLKPIEDAASTLEKLNNVDIEALKPIIGKIQNPSNKSFSTLSTNKNTSSIKSKSRTHNKRDKRQGIQRRRLLNNNKNLRQNKNQTKKYNSHER